MLVLKLASHFGGGSKVVGAVVAVVVIVVVDKELDVAVSWWALTMMSR